MAALIAIWMSRPVENVAPKPMGVWFSLTIRKDRVWHGVLWWFLTGACVVLGGCDRADDTGHTVRGLVCACLGVHSSIGRNAAAGIAGGLRKWRRARPVARQRVVPQFLERRTQYLRRPRQPE